MAKVVDHPIATAKRDYTKHALQAFFEDLIAEETDADFGFYNMGGIRDRIRQGTVTAQGSVLKTMLTMDDETHHRTSEIDEARVYRVATKSFVSAQLNRAALGQIIVEESNELMRDVLIRLIRDSGIQITASPASQN